MTDCPLEHIAAFHEGTLSGPERARVLEHVTSCGQCTDTLMILDAAAQENVTTGKVVRGRFGGRSRFVAPAAAAAALATWLFIGPFSRSGMDKLVAAAEQVNERPVAARLSADFPHRDHRTMRGHGDAERNQWNLEATAYEVASGKDRHAVGVAFLLLGPKHSEDALKELQAAASQRPKDPKVLTDLSAAYYARNDFANALQAADAALAIEETPAALWNRALALEGLGRRKDAIDAWNRYLLVDPNSAWAAEVNEKHLSLLKP